MKKSILASIIQLAILLAVQAGLSPARADQFAFNYFLPPGNVGGAFTTVTASGVITTLDGTDIITGITGAWDGVGITGLIPAGGFQGNDNLLFPASVDPGCIPAGQALDGCGVSFTVANPFLGDDGFGNVNLFFDGSLGEYREAGDVPIATSTFNISQIPEPNLTALLAGGLLALAYFRRKAW